MSAASEAGQSDELDRVEKRPSCPVCGGPSTNTGRGWIERYAAHAADEALGEVERRLRLDLPRGLIHRGSGWVGYEGPRRQAWREIEEDLRGLIRQVYPTGERP